MYIPPKNDPAYSLQRLNIIMGRRRLSFNPYTVSDERLMEIASSTGWGNENDLTQIVIMKFNRFRGTNDYRKYDGLLVTIGNSEEEIYIPTGVWRYGVRAYDSNMKEHSLLGKTPINSDKRVEKLLGRTVFISRTIPGNYGCGGSKVAYRMHKLTGDTAKDAQVIRSAMIDAKIEMLERLLKWPEYWNYLSCEKGIINYERRIQRAIEIIKDYPNISIPR